MIYKITNNINNKIYIGGTVKTNPKERLKEHLAHAKKYNSQTQKMKDMRNFPKNSWNIQKIEDCKNSELKEREEFFIKKHINEGYELYNEQINSGHSTIFYSMDIKTKEIKEYNSFKETGCRFSKVSSVLNQLKEKEGYTRKSHNGKLWSYENNEEKWKELMENDNKRKLFMILLLMQMKILEKIEITIQ